MTAAEKQAGAASPGHRKWLRVRIVQVCQVVRGTASRKGRLQGSSCMHGNVPVQFLGEGVVATPSPYPTSGQKAQAKTSQRAAFPARQRLRWSAVWHQPLVLLSNRLSL